MKKGIFVIALAIAMVFGITACNSTSESSSQIETTVAPDIDNYEYGTFNKFNSYADDNGLKDTPIYIKGTVKSVNDFANSITLSIKSEDDGRWLATFINQKYTDDISDMFDEQDVTCFGKYAGYSDVFLMPSIHLEKVQVGNKIYTNSDFANEKTTVAPTTEKVTEKPTEKATEKSTKNIDELIYDENSVKVFYIGKEIESDGTQKFNLRIENNNSADLTATTMYVTANDYVVNPIFRVDVPSKKKANESIYFMDSELKKNNIEEVNELEFTLHFFDTHSSITDDNVNSFSSESIQIKP